MNWCGWPPMQTASSPSPTIIPAIRWCARHAPWWPAATSARFAWCRWNMRRLARRTAGSDRTEAGGLADRSGALGPGGAIGDIGSHAFHLACFVTGRVPEQSWRISRPSLPGRRVDDNAHVLLRFAGGARGMLWASQVAHGHENALRLRVYGERGGLEWAQEEPDRLWFTPSDQPRASADARRRRRCREAARIARLPAGHPRAIWRVSRPSMPRSHGAIARRARAPHRRRR